MSQGESKLSRDIMAALRARGAFVWKNHGGPTMMAGLPDITGCYKGVFFALETKMPEGKEPTEIQRLRHDQIRQAGGLVYVPRSVREATKWFDATVVPFTRLSSLWPSEAVGRHQFMEHPDHPGHCMNANPARAAAVCWYPPDHRDHL